MILKRPFRGGASVPHRKQTAEQATLVMPVPPKVIVPLLQHTGVICDPKVQKGDFVKVGQILGDSDKLMAVPIHSSVSGKVTNVDLMLWAGGIQVTSVEIETDGQQELAPGLAPPVVQTKADFLTAVRASGLVGLGGAGFPTHVKLAPPAGKTIDTLIINAAECEPYITSDYREILENTESIAAGVRAVATHLGISKVLIGIEDNKPKAVEVLKQAFSGDPKVRVMPLRTRYPQGAEKMLIWATARRAVGVGKLPSDVGVIVLNVTTASFLGKYLKTGVPLIKKRVTVAGDCVKNPQNVEVLIGTPLADVFQFAGGFVEEPRKVIMGGPMMGVAQHSLETSVVKHTNALLALPASEGQTPAASACIRCGRCLTACPMGLAPLLLNRSALKNDTEILERYEVMACIECGSCAFVCPSKIQLVQGIRLGKTQVRLAEAKRKAQANQPTTGARA